MARRPLRSRLVQRLVTPVRDKIRRPVPRIRRSFPAIRPRWSQARWLWQRRRQTDANLPHGGSR